MNRIIIAVVVILILLGIGGYYVMSQKGSQTANPSTAATSPTTSAGMFGSIKDALSKSLSLQCVYEENGKKTTAYIKAGAVRADMMGGTKEENGSVIVKDNKMYFWNGKEGMMLAFNINEMVVPSGTTAKSAPSKAPNADFMEGLEKYKDACKPATVADTLFVPPTDVKFTDQTKMMEDAQKLMKGVTPGSAMSEEDLKKLMQQYQPSTTP